MGLQINFDIKVSAWAVSFCLFLRLGDTFGISRFRYEHTPKLLMDFDVAAIFNALPDGVNLPCFIDCCHSATITRMLVGLAPEHFTGVDERPRLFRSRPIKSPRF